MKKRKFLRHFIISSNAGMVIVEFIIILVVLIGIVIIFKQPLTEVIETILSKIIAVTAS